MNIREKRDIVETDGIILLEYREAESPYIFKAAGIKVYSIEELSYYIYHNIYLFTEDMVDEKLIKWLGSEVGNKVLAEKLAKLKKQGNDLKDIVTTILCSNDFYTEREIKFLIGIMEDMEKLSLSMRHKMKADALIRHQSYHGAALEYEWILKHKGQEDFSSEEYGNILHNLGVAHIHMASLMEASREFKEAYLFNRNKESMYCYFMSLKLSRQDEVFEDEARHLGISGEEIREIEYRMAAASEEAKNLAISKKLKAIKELKLRGRVNEYYQGIDYIMNSWKRDYAKRQ